MIYTINKFIGNVAEKGLINALHDDIQETVGKHKVELAALVGSAALGMTATEGYAKVDEPRLVCIEPALQFMVPPSKESRIAKCNIYFPVHWTTPNNSPARFTGAVTFSYHKNNRVPYQVTLSREIDLPNYTTKMIVGSDSIIFDDRLHSDWDGKGVMHPLRHLQATCKPDKGIRWACRENKKEIPVAQLVEMHDGLNDLITNFCYARRLNSADAKMTGMAYRLCNEFWYKVDEKYIRKLN